MNKPMVIYILGTSRSGSTILSLYLTISGLVPNIGEAKYILTKGMQENWLCSCNQNFYDCEFWKTIIKNTSFLNNNLYSQLIDQIPYMRLRHLLLRKIDIINSINMEYLDFLKELYLNIFKESKTKYVIDASKDPIYALFLSCINEIDLKIIHLVRNPCGVVSSQTRKDKYNITSSNENKKVMGTTFKNSIVSWNLCNYLAEKFFPDKITVKYESFINNPLESKRKILDQIGIHPVEEMGDKECYEKYNHQFSGNPNRFTQEIKIKNDPVQCQLKMYKKIFANFVSLPLILKYKYTI